MGSDHPELTLGTIDGKLYMGVQGRATQRTCPTAERTVEDFIAAHPSEPGVIIDIRGCDWVDSTFAGWLIGVKKRLQRSAGKLQVTGCSDRCRSTLARMHLDELLDFVETPPPADTETLPCGTSDHPTTAELNLMLQSHERLANLGPENARIFNPIVETLRAQLEAAKQNAAT